jgi:hypothetical protein
MHPRPRKWIARPMNTQAILIILLKLLPRPLARPRRLPFHIIILFLLPDSCATIFLQILQWCFSKSSIEAPHCPSSCFDLGIAVAVVLVAGFAGFAGGEDVEEDLARKWSVCI